MGEPVLVNPNSFKNLETIMEQLHENAIKNSEREWLFVGADGPPYCLMRRLLEKKPSDYDWVSLVSVGGHLNMNLLKTFFKITEKIILEPLGKEILKYDISFDYLINCKDNHKAWQAFDIFLNGTIMKLIRMYRAEEINTPTPIGFFNWQSTVENPVLKLVCELTLTIGLGIYIHRVGERNNDYWCNEAGRLKCIDMFFEFNHPIYREVEYSDLKNKVLYPDIVKQRRKINVSFSDLKSMQNTNHQSGDFKLEENVKSLKRIAPKGNVSSETWQKIARSHDKVKSIVDHTMNLLSFNDCERGRNVNIDREIIKWRTLLRHSRHLKVQATVLLVYMVTV